MCQMDRCIVLVSMLFMVWMLVKDMLRPGVLLFSVVVLLMTTGVLTPEEALSGFSNKCMITVALLFLVSEGVRRTDCLGVVMRRIFPSKEHNSVRRGHICIMTVVTAFSAFLNNTPIVVIFIPHIKAWAKRMGLPIKKFLIPLSYAAILGGMCTLIGTSTNLVVHGLMLESGMEGFAMFEFAKIGGPIAIAGIAYIVLFGNRRLPGDDSEADEQMLDQGGNSDEECGPMCPAWKRWLALGLLVMMIAGATIGDMESVRQTIPGQQLDMFFWACVVAVIMLFTGIIPPKRYTKFISWDILITIASALAISEAMAKSGLADWVARGLIGISSCFSPIVILALLFIVTNIVTELITNNAAAAFAFPIAVSVSQQLGVSPMPFIMAICIAASCSFSSPIGYQTNMIVQGIGGYKFRDFLRVGLPLNIIALLLSIILIPIFWPF